MFSYFQLLYEYFSLISLLHLTLFTTIYGHFHYFLSFWAISPLATFGESNLFLSILAYFTLGYFLLL
jgi:hypothetical protein